MSKVSQTEQLALIAGYSSIRASNWLASLSRHYSRSVLETSLSDVKELGNLVFPNGEKVAVFEISESLPLSDGFAKKRQFNLAKKLVNSKFHSGADAVLVFFHDHHGNFRLSLVQAQSNGNMRIWNNPRRSSFLVSVDQKNKTFMSQFGHKEIVSLLDLEQAFSITKVTEDFYLEFEAVYKTLVRESVLANPGVDQKRIEDFSLLLVIRTIFLGFIQKKMWLGDDENFLANSIKNYQIAVDTNRNYYKDFLCPLFFEGLNTPFGTDFSKYEPRVGASNALALRDAPYLNGGLFRPKAGFDDANYVVLDETIHTLYDFLFSYNFTIEENSVSDQDLQLNPEFLGIIFERLINKADGAVYTPRAEVDLMCRLSLTEWLHDRSGIDAEKLRKLFFHEVGNPEDQDQGDLSGLEKRNVLNLLENISICDPAVGSGAFLVGMLQVLEEIEEMLDGDSMSTPSTRFSRKKEIIASSLFGVEVREWAVWICQLRLWLSIFVDAPESERESNDPILPSLDFKVRHGDSLVQTVGGDLMPLVARDRQISKTTISQLEKLSKAKSEYFRGVSGLQAIDLQELEDDLFRNLLSNQIEEEEVRLQNALGSDEFISVDLFGETAPLKGPSKSLKIERIRANLESLQGQLNKLKEVRSLVWTIEFIDVFASKGGFDLVIGNPPYVKQQEITDPLMRVSDPKKYKEYLVESLQADFPDDLTKSIQISGQSDLYTYFYVHSLKLLNPQGLLTFICSNSWLDIGYGEWLRKFILKRVPLIAVIDNHSKKSFASADVNTVITLMKAPQSEIPREFQTKFIAFKKPFEEVCYSETIHQALSATSITNTESFRSYPVSYSVLSAPSLRGDGKLSAIAESTLTKWGGSYLRSPDLYLKVVEGAKERLTTLNAVAIVGGYVHDNSTGGTFPKLKFINLSKAPRV